MPDFVSSKSTLDQATVELRRKYHLVPEPRFGNSDLPKDVIYQQEPSPETVLTPSTKVILWVSNGQPTVQPTTPTADISVEKNLDTKGPYRAGQKIQYTIIVSNAGESPATTVEVGDTPTNIKLDKISGACEALPCTIKSIDGGSQARIIVMATIVTDGAFDNVVTVKAVEGDRTTTKIDNLDNGGTASPTVDVSATETLDTVGPFSVGQSVQYTILVTNAGPSVATNISIIEKRDNLTIKEVSGACNRLPCSIPNLSVNEVATIIVTASIDREGSFGYGAEVAAAEPDADPSNNNVRNIGDFAITSSPPPPPPPPPCFPWCWWLVPILIGVLGTTGVTIYVIKNLLKPSPVPADPSPGPPIPPPVPTVPVIKPKVKLENGGSSLDGLPMAGPQINLRTGLEMGEVYFEGPIPIVKIEVTNE
jgi:hypothetical protein